MAFRRDDINTETIAEFLQDAVKKIKAEEDPLVLNELKKIFKQNVPFTLRMYTAAYLTKILTGSPSKRLGKFERGSPKKRDFNAEQTRTPRVSIEESLAETIFISVGRNRRVFPRDLISLLITIAEVPRERIGDIRILDNYSFVQVFAEDVEKIIAALNGHEFHGRKLSVSYSRKKDEVTENTEESSNEDNLQDQSEE